MNCFLSKNSIFVKISLLSLLSIFASCTKDHSGDKGNRPKNGERSAKGGPIAVKVIQAKKETRARKIEILTALLGRSQADVYSKVVGRIAEIGPKEGTYVKSGAVLFRVDRNDSGETFLSMPVQSPISGWISRWNTNVGSQVGLQDSVVSVVDDQYLRATVPLLTKDWALFSNKTAVEFIVEDKSRAAKIVTISRSADANSGRGSFIAEISNTDHKLKSGMLAKIVVQIEPKERIILPNNAFTLTDQGSFVWTVVEGKAKRVPIKFNLFGSDEIEILSELLPGTSVINVGGQSLTDGAEVKIIENKP